MKANVAQRAALLYLRALDQLEDVVKTLEKEDAKGESVAVVVGVLRGVELVLKALERTRSDAGADVARTLTDLMRAWREELSREDLEKVEERDLLLT